MRGYHRTAGKPALAPGGIRRSLELSANDRPPPGETTFFVVPSNIYILLRYRRAGIIR